MHETLVDCSIEGCGWPVAYEFTLPDDWRSGVYIVRSYARRDVEVFDHRVVALAIEDELGALVGVFGGKVGRQGNFSRLPSGL